MSYVPSTPAQREEMLRAVGVSDFRDLLETWEEMPPMFLTSAEKKEGRDEVLNYIEHINDSLS